MRTSHVLAAVLLLGPGCKTAPEPLEDVVEQYPDELLIEDLVLGTGEKALNGLRVTVHYRGTLTSGEVFDSSLARAPLTFRLGSRQVIKGWDQGLLGMQVGGKRRLTIPPRLGYGSRTTGSIPAGSHLLFDVELLAVSP